MLKRWAALPRGIRWMIGGIVAVALAVAIGWVLSVPAADWLAHHDVGSTKVPSLQPARDAARGRLLTLAAGLVAAVALLFTALNFNLLRRNSERTDQWQRRTHELTEQGQVTDRYTKAIEQLGSGQLDVRIGGIYALERIANDSARDHPTVMEVLTAFIREHSHEPWPEPKAVPPEPEQLTRPDVQAALTVIGRRDEERDTSEIDLSDANLPGANLSGAKFASAKLTGANLTRADLTYARIISSSLVNANLSAANLGRAKLLGTAFIGADLTGAKLGDANLTRATLMLAKLADADLRGTVLSAANFSDADLSGADLSLARAAVAMFTEAKLTGAKLLGTDFDGAYLTDADLSGADLTGADLTGAWMTGANFTGALFTGTNLTGGYITDGKIDGRPKPSAVPVPEGWKLDTSSGRLERAGTGSGSAEAN